MNKIAIALLVITFASCAKNKEAKEKVTEQVQPKKEEVTQSKKVLFVLTSHAELGDTGVKTGFWVEEFATPYYFLKDKGFEITLASPKGGQPPIDPKSELPDFQTESTKRFNNDKEAKDQLANTLKLTEVRQSNFDAIFYPGGHGPLWDLSEDQNSISLIEEFYKNNKPVAAVCHAPAVFKNTKNEDGTSLVKGKKVTGFTNGEEAAVALTEVVPFLVEDMLKENGGIYSKAADWNPYAVEDGLLITGQNPASAELVADLLVKKLQ
ncbi:type 1 glutamine amidotransferase domain-containing protein [Aquimarina gracilis]|uniref:Type 1 glutamine amidotransferase domain-containing protein n=1 Tax=Aquimarina gracilis TaxID=874422 RepID=A0ABU6A1N6_9FLAO|nr:type 1 glutamine amidotransferase domain-containing protein [Aquimarina gracilis]MEB3348053.1 type 1 glutamine amidotransferase domain-containing protein [Aquimarina gracilis]